MNDTARNVGEDEGRAQRGAIPSFCYVLLRVFMALCVTGGAFADLPAAAHSYSKGDLHVRHPWTRATAAGDKFAVAYIEIRNSGRQPDRVVGVSTPAADRVELHSTKRGGDSAKTRKVTSFEVPARWRLLLSPGGSHLALVGLRKPLVKGHRIPLSLRFERAGELKVELEVQAAGSKRAHH
jgi:periplasmic copper chaperone A